MDQIKISQIFESIQGEGKYNGTPMLFIRTSGCNRNCEFCDTKYHTEGKFYDIPSLIKIINDSKLDYVCWTGGEPLLWAEQIKEVVKHTPRKYHHIETNGDLLGKVDIGFQYIACSPKDEKTAKKVAEGFFEAYDKDEYDIKVVTDLKTEGVKSIPYATMLMPLTTYFYNNEIDHEKEEKIKQKVWEYCTKNNLKYACRSHIETWGYKQSGK